MLASNFSLPQSAFDNLPADIEHERYIFETAIPETSAKEAAQALASPYGAVPESFSYHLSEQTPKQLEGGRVLVVDSGNFTVSRTIAAALVEVEPGGLRELHWHPNTDEWQYYLSGQARMTVFASGGTARTFDYSGGDVGYVPFAMGHYVQNTGTEPLRFLELFRSNHFADVSLSQWLALTPPGLVRAQLNFDDQAMSAFTPEKRIVVKQGP